VVVIGAPGVALIGMPRVLRVKHQHGATRARMRPAERRTKNARLTASRFSTSARKTGGGKSKAPGSFLVVEASACDGLTCPEERCCKGGEPL
jgi:hypothetical protein